MKYYNDKQINLFIEKFTDLELLHNNYNKYNHFFYSVYLPSIFKNIKIPQKEINVYEKTQEIDFSMKIYNIYILFCTFCANYFEYYDEHFDIKYLNNNTFLQLINPKMYKVLKQQYKYLLKSTVNIFDYKKKYWFFVNI